MHLRRLAASIALGALALAGALGITSGAGPGLDPDSMSYLNAANTLAKGSALRDVDRDWTSVDSTMPLSHWPPGYPIAIASAERLGFGPMGIARALNAIAAFVTVGVISWLVAIEVSTGAGIIAGLLVMVTPVVVQVHENVLSEPLFIALLVLALATMLRVPARPLISGTLAGLASIVRYAGLSVVAGVVLWQFLRAGTLRDRVVRAMTAAIPAIVLQALWVFRTVHKAGPRSIREISFYGELGPTLREGWGTVSAWFLPGMSEQWATSLALAVAALLAFGIWKALPRRWEQLPSLAPALLAVSYAALLLVSRLVADLTIPLDDRLMAPLFILLEVALVMIIAPAWRTWPNIVKVPVAMLVVLWWAAAIRVSSDSARYAVRSGNDLAERCWRDSPLVAWVRAHGEGHALYTNVPEALYFHAGRLSHEFPDERDAQTADAFADTLARRNALIVEFNDSCYSVDEPDSLLDSLPLREVTSMPTGRVLAPSAPAPDTFRVRRP
ncbi:MAG: hypothetical protein ABI889_02750 [Gemmatimonadota bacterium]